MVQQGRPPAPIEMRKTPIWQLSIRPVRGLIWRSTPTLSVPFFVNPVARMTPIAPEPSSATISAKVSWIAC